MEIVTITTYDLERLIERAVMRALNPAPEPDPEPDPEPEREWITTREVAAILGVHPKSVISYVRRGLPRKMLGKKTARYERSAVLAWIASRKR